jgi:hypothetical protein
MTVRVVSSGTVALEGICPIEDAEALQQQLLSNPEAAVDWSACVQAHTAVIQVLLAAQPKFLGPPAGDFLMSKLAAQLSRSN